MRALRSAALELRPSVAVNHVPAAFCPHMAGHLLHPAPARALLFCTKREADDANGRAFAGLERYAALRRCLPSASVCSRATVSYDLRLISSGWLAWATNGSLSRG